MILDEFNNLILIKQNLSDTKNWMTVVAAIPLDIIIITN